MNIKEVSKKLDISSHTLRYYEKIGLISIKRSSNSSIRVYSNKDVIDLEYIIGLKKIGFSLEEIKVYLDLKKEDFDTLTKRRDLLEIQWRKVEIQIKQLNNIRNSILEKLDCIKERIDEYDD